MKEEFNAPKYSYDKANKAWVTFTNGKPKIKLRKYVADKAKMLYLINGRPLAKNKSDLKEAYNIGGLEAMQTLINEEVAIAIDKQKQSLKKQKENERI